MLPVDLFQTDAKLLCPHDHSKLPGREPGTLAMANPISVPAGIRA
jgi:hypothetical protein